MLKSIPELIQSIRPQVRCATAADAQQEMINNQGVLIDVREPQEYAEHAVEAAVNYPRGVLEMKVLAQYPNAKQPLYIHCATGARATLAAEQLQRLGYENVTVITCDLEVISKQL